MRVQIQFLEEIQYEKVAYYTAEVVGKEQSEFHDFIYRMAKGQEKDVRQLAEINRLIQNIGRYTGAQDDLFKREGHAVRLPHATYRFIDSDGETDFGLRLYCIVINETIVILLNGDRKTSQSIKDCPNCYPHFKFANELADSIHYAIEKGEVEIDGRDFLTEEDYCLEI